MTTVVLETDLQFDVGPPFWSHVQRSRYISFTFGHLSSGTAQNRPVVYLFSYILDVVVVGGNVSNFLLVGIIHGRKMRYV